MKNMKHYVQKMSSLFDGMRLDNLHSSDPWVATYLMTKARQVNPHLLVFGELFTGDNKKDGYLTKTIGLNYLVREWQNNCCPADLNVYGQVHSHPIGTLHSLQYNHMLQPQSPPALYYDLTHDNPSYHHFSNYQQSLVIIPLLAFLNCSFASTFGFDELFL